MKLPSPTPSLMVAWCRGQREKPKTNIFKNSPAPTPVSWSRGRVVKEFYLPSLATTQPRTQHSLEPKQASNPNKPQTQPSLKPKQASNPTQPRTQPSLEPNTASNPKNSFVKNSRPTPSRVVSWSRGQKEKQKTIKKFQKFSSPLPPPSLMVAWSRGERIPFAMLSPNPTHPSSLQPNPNKFFIINLQLHPQSRGLVVAWSKRETKGNL